MSNIPKVIKLKKKITCNNLKLWDYHLIISLNFVHMKPWTDNSSHLVRDIAKSHWSKDCSHRDPLLWSISWLTLITDWLWADWIPIIKKSPPAPRLVCYIVLVCMCLSEYIWWGLSQFTRLQGGGKGNSVGGGGEGSDHHSTQTHTQKCTHQGQRGQSRRPKIPLQDWLLFFFFILFCCKNLYWLPILLHPHSLSFSSCLLPLLFLVADLSWVKHKR